MIRATIAIVASLACVAAQAEDSWRSPAGEAIEAKQAELDQRTKSTDQTIAALQQQLAAAEAKIEEQDMRLKEWAPALTLLAALAADVDGQDKVFLVGGKPAYDVKKSFGLVQSSSSSDVLTANQNTLQEKIDAGVSLADSQWYFPPNRNNNGTYNSQFRFRDTLILPAYHGGRAWVGQGRGLASGTGNTWGGHICLNANSSLATNFDGTTNKLTSSGATNVITVTGRAVVARTDQYNSVYISGGTNTIPGWYTITTANAGEGTWTVSRNWCTGAVTAGTGRYVPAILRDHGRGNELRGLMLNAAISGAAGLPKGSVGIHVSTNQQSSGNNTGKHTYENLAINNCEVGILVGGGLDRFEDDTVSSWYHYNALHADNMSYRNLWFSRCNNGLVVRTSQSVGHCATDTNARLENGYAFVFDAGGKLVANKVHMSGNSSGSVGAIQGLLRLGRDIASNSGPFTIRGVDWDGGGTSRNPQLIKARTGSGRTTVTIADVLINRDDFVRGPEDQIPVVDIQGCVNLFLDRGQCGNAANHGLWANSIQLRGEGSLKPYMEINGWRLGVTNPEGIIDEANCHAGITVVFRGCTNISGTPFTWTDENGNVTTEKVYVTIGGVAYHNQLRQACETMFAGLSRSRHDLTALSLAP